MKNPFKFGISREEVEEIVQSYFDKQGSIDLKEHYSKRENREYMYNGDPMHMEEERLKAKGIPKPEPFNIRTVIAPSLEVLREEGKINQLQYEALSIGDRNDILLAFNLELFEDCDNYVNAILIKKSLEDGE
jgi:hypothetical protein